jgi:hypothetical protein
MLKAMLYSFVNAIQSYKTTTHWGDAKSSDASKKFHDPRHHYIERKHTFLYVKFEGALFSSFKKTYLSKESGTFSYGMVHPFSKSRGLKWLNGGSQRTTTAMSFFVKKKAKVVRWELY